MDRVGNALALGLTGLTALLSTGAAGGSGDDVRVARAVQREPPVLTAREAQGVSTLVRFLDAFNRRDLRQALAAFTIDPRFVRFVNASDCDYRRVKYLRFAGRQGVTRWLRARFADRDRLVMSRVRVVAGPGLAVEYVRRTSNTLRALGFPEGIREGLGTKVGLTSARPVRITSFANAGPPDESCRPVR